MMNTTSHRVLLLALLLSPGTYALAQDVTPPAPVQVELEEAPTVATESDPVTGALPVTIAQGEKPQESEPTPPVTDDVEADSATAQDEADADYALIYGAPQDGTYNPVADPTLPEPAMISEVWDPWEKTNRRIHSFNKVLDGRIAKPLARKYVAIVPRRARLGVNNFFNNLRLPVSAVNSLLQGKPGNAGRNLARFVVNSTLGIGGLVDAAADANLTERAEDFGQTMGTWGWQRSRYVELPFFGPRTIRDTIGMVVDAPLSPVRHVNDQNVRIGLQGLSLIDVRAELLSLDGLTEGIEDDYKLIRDTWSRRRAYQINSDRRKSKDEEQLPDYLDDDRNPQTPADVIPVLPGR